MKTLVIYQSEYGNTMKVAEAISSGLRDATGDPDGVQLKHVNDVVQGDLSEIDLLVVGCPTQKFSPMPATKAFLTSIPSEGLQGVAVAAYDTRITEQEFADHGRIVAALPKVFGYAAGPIAKRLQKKGGNLVAEPKGFYVAGTEGPLLEGELKRAGEWGRQLAQSF